MGERSGLRPAWIGLEAVGTEEYRLNSIIGDRYKPRIRSLHDSQTLRQRKNGS